MIKSIEINIGYSSSSLTTAEFLKAYTDALFVVSTTTIDDSYDNDYIRINSHSPIFISLNFGLKDAIYMIHQTLDDRQYDSFYLKQIKRVGNEVLNGSLSLHIATKRLTELTTLVPYNILNRISMGTLSDDYSRYIDYHTRTTIAIVENIIKTVDDGNLVNAIHFRMEEFFTKAYRTVILKSNFINSDYDYDKDEYPLARYARNINDSLIHIWIPSGLPIMDLRKSIESVIDTFGSEYSLESSEYNGITHLIINDYNGLIQDEAVMSIGEVVDRLLNKPCNN